MSESSARNERRALRRAMGPHVQAFTSDTTQAIQTLQAGLGTVHAQLSEQEQRCRDRVATAVFIAHRVEYEQQRFVQRGWRDRLRWLLTGR